MKFITTSDGDWKTKRRGYMIKYKDLLIAMSIDDVLDKNVFQETVVPTHKEPGVRVFKSKSLNFDQYSPIAMREVNKFLDDVIMEMNEVPPQMPPLEDIQESKGLVVRNKRRNTDDGVQTTQMASQQKPIAQTVQPMNTTLVNDREATLSQAHPILSSMLKTKEAPNLKRKRHRKRGGRRRRRMNTTEASVSSVKRQLLPQMSEPTTQDTREVTITIPEGKADITTMPESNATVNFNDYPTINTNDYPQMSELGEIMQSCGIVCG